MYIILPIIIQEMGLLYKHLQWGFPPVQTESDHVTQLATGAENKIKRNKIKSVISPKSL